MRVVVAGGSGKVGRAAIRALNAAGQRAVNVDIPLIDTPSAAPVATYFAGAPLRELAGTQLLPPSTRAGRLIGSQPRHSWLDMKDA